MDCVELYRQLLGLTAPWTVERVELNMAHQHVEVHVGHEPGHRFACPECGREPGVYDHLGERAWRHLDSCQFLTYPHARAPRVSCPEHGVRHVTLPWAQPGSRFTNLFEALAIDVLLAANIKRAAWNRRTAHPERYLWDTVTATAPLGETEPQVPAQRTAAKRTARLTVRCAAVQLRAPKRHAALKSVSWRFLARSICSHYRCRPQQE